MTAKEIMNLIRSVGMDKVYLYVLHRHTGEPFYVGIGKAARVTWHEQEAFRTNGVKGWKRNIIRKTIAQGHDIDRRIVAWFDSWDEAVQAEIKMIKEIGRADLGEGPLTNLTDGGDGAVGTVISQEMREQIAAALRGRKRPPETIARMSAALTGRKLSPEAVEKIRADVKARPPASEETRRKLSENAKRMTANPAWKERVREKRKGWHPSEEAKEKMRQAKLGKKLTEEHKAKVGAAGRGRRNTAETKEKMKAAAATRFKPVLAAGIEYECAADAAKALGVTVTTISNRANALKPGYRWILPQEEASTDEQIEQWVLPLLA